MAEIFISYRRVDAEFAADRLRGDLVRAFGEGSVFMDRHPGGIPWGADWEQELLAALDGCAVLLAIVGTEWLGCQRTPGGPRRLDLADDWVRNEILHALGRRIDVLPVWVNGADAPPAEQLPEALRAARFQFRNGYPMSNGHWEGDLARLVAALLRQARLRERHVRAMAPGGLRLITYLARDGGAAAEPLLRSRQAIEQTDSDFRLLRFYKGIHDELHAIQVDVLIQLQQGDLSSDTVWRNFHASQVAIDGTLEAAPGGTVLPPKLRANGSLRVDLGAAAAALAEAEKAPGERATARAVDSLERLLSHMEAVELLMEGAATAAKLAALVRELNALRRALRQALPKGSKVDSDPELKPLLQRIRVLAQLQIELGHRLAEHAELQELDADLRRLCKGHLGHGEPDDGEWAGLQADWHAIREQRPVLAHAVSRALADEIGLLRSDRDGIDQAIGANERALAARRLRSFFSNHTRTFRRVDSELKNFLASLAEVTAPMRTVLDMCQLGGSHG